MADHDHVESRDSRALAVALAINTAFLIVELAGALLADSLTLLADAAHMLTDSASLGLALFAAWIASRPADDRRTYGYQRAEVLAALINGLFLLIVVGYILLDAYQRLQDPRPVVPELVVIVGLAGLGANLAAAAVLGSHRENINVRGAYLHLLADAAGSVAAVIVGVALLFTDLYILDPLFALLIAALVLYATVGLLRESGNVLMQGVPSDVDVDAVAAVLRDIPGVETVHDVHVWALSTTERSMSAHLVVAEDVDRDAVLSRAGTILASEFGLDHATLQVESSDRCETVTVDCYAGDQPDAG